MTQEEFIIAFISIIGGLSLVAFLFWGIFSLIKSWINRKSGSQQIDPQFFKALGEFKKSTDRRLSNLEAIVSDLDETKTQINVEGKNPAQIEIDEEEFQAKDSKENSGNLRNMLNE